MKAAWLLGAAALVASPGHAEPRALFAPTLADAPVPTGPERARPDVAKAWTALAAAPEAKRQAARWRLARALLAADLAPDASGVLAAMRGDEPDLDLVPAFALARGRALTATGRHGDAWTALSAPALRANPEACAWRLRAAEAAGDMGRALSEVTCADRAIRGRDVSGRAPFVLAAARAAVDGGRPEPALRWLGQLPDGDPNANNLRGRAWWALGKREEAKLRLERARRAGGHAVRLDATLRILELFGTEPKAVLRQADDLGFAWRGDGLERRALLLSRVAAKRLGDERRAIGAGASLLRYHPPGPDTADILPDMRARLAAALAPGASTPLPHAAGMFWEHRDLMPAGADGDRMAHMLAERLAEAGLYRQAAGLLEHQLFRRAEDLAKGPLSVRVATLRLLAGDPRQALAALRRSDGPRYGEAVRAGRAEVEAVALATLGKTDEALAVLDSVPGTGALRAELLWRDERWDAYVRAAPAPGRLDAVGQTIVLRRAVALAMLGREGELAALRARYAGRFGAAPTARAFALLTGPADAAGAGLAEAMAAMPDASPAGDNADLLDAAALSRR